MTAFHSVLEIVGVMVYAAHDNQVFQPTGYDELAFAQKSEVAGTQKRSVSVRCVCVEDFRGLGGALPIALCDAGPGDPYFADRAGLGWQPRPGIHDGDERVWSDFAAAHKHVRCGAIAIAISRAVTGLRRLASEMTRSARHGAGRAAFTRDDQRRFGQAVRRTKGGGAEAAWFEAF